MTQLVARIDPTGRRRLYVLSAVLVVLVAQAVSHSPKAGVIIAAGLCAAGLAVGLHMSGILSPLWPLVIVGVFLPLNGIRPLEAVTVGDIMLMATGGVALIVVRRSKPPLQVVIVLVGTLIVTAGGVFGMIATQNWGAYIEMGKFILGAPMVIVIIMLLDPKRSIAYLLLTAYATGALISTWSGMTQNIDPAFGRASGLGAHAGHLALAAQLGFFVWVGWALLARDIRIKIMCAVFAVFCVYGVLISGTRTALLGLLVGVVILAVAAGGRGLLIMGGSLFGLVLAYFFVVPFLPNKENIYRAVGQSDEAAPTDSAHAEALREGLRTIGDHPFTGAGFSVGQLAHNLEVQVAAVGGLVALVGFLVIWVPILLIGGQRILGGLSARNRDNIMPLCLMAAVAAYFVFAQFQPLIWDRHLWFFIALTLYVQVPFDQTPPDIEERRTVDGRAVAGSAVSLSAAPTTGQLARP